MSHDCTVRLLRSLLLVAAVSPAACLTSEPTQLINPDPLPSQCSLPPESGPCEAAIPRWHFDQAAGQCVQFTFGGCGGNTNNFTTQQACASTCGGTAEPVRCGGWLGQTCAADEFCDFASDGCDYADASGVCAPRPTACTEEDAPVCGCGGRTYGHFCAAQAAGLDAAAAGACNVSCTPMDCGPKPGVPNTVCEDGSLGGPICDSVDGQCAWQIRECPGPDRTCPDNSRDMIVLGGSRSFGFCAGSSCVSNLSIVPSAIAMPGACDGVQLEVCGHDDSECSTHIGTLTTAGHNQARAVAAELENVSLRSVYGCPDCADGGASTVQLQRLEDVSSHTYDFSGPPEELRAADTFVQGLIDSLRQCRSSALIEVSEGCEAVE